MFCCIEQSIFRYKWSSLVEHILRPEIFEMAAMPFPCNGILPFQGTLPRVSPVFTYNYASCHIPYINLFLIVYGARWHIGMSFYKPNVIFYVAIVMKLFVNVRKNHYHYIC